MAEIIETANNAYEERDKANDQIDGLRSKAKREAKDFETELKDISSQAENNKITMEIMNKNYEKKMDRVDQREINSVNDKITKIKSSKGLKSQTVDPQLAETHYKLRMDYVKIELTTNIKKFDELIETFKKLEETNFEKFKYVMELSNEIEFVEHQIAEYRTEKKNHLEKGNSKTENKTKHLKELDDKSQSCQSRAQFFESKFNSSQKTLNSITTLVEKLFNEIECDKAEANRVSGTQGVGESNLLQYLGLIEKRLLFILEFYDSILKERNQGSKNQQRMLEFERAEAAKNQKAENAKIPDFGRLK